MNQTLEAPTRKIANQTYLAECYTKHPQTGEPGWDIKMVWVLNCRDVEHVLPPAL